MQILSRRGFCGHIALISIVGAGLGRGARAAGEQFRLDPQTTALIVVDLQQSNSALPFVPIPFGDVAQRSAELAKSFRQAGALVVYTHVIEEEVLSLPTDKPIPAGKPSPGGDELVAAAGFVLGDVLVTKRQWGAFYGSDLDQELRRRRIRTLVLTGLAAEAGIESTARSAYDQGYELVFASDAISGASQRSNLLFVGELFPRMGRVRTSQQVAAAL